jgi:hypothetical protein
MIRAFVCLTGLIAASFVPSFQTRVKPKGEADFLTTLESAKKAWEDKHYGQCVEHMNQALGIVHQKRSQAILSALPAAPEGFEIVPEREPNAAAANPMLAAMTASIGSVTEREYVAKSGNGNIRVSVTADSPLVSVFNMWVTNPAMLEENSELVEYGEHKAVFKNMGGGRDLELQILINKVHMCQINASGLGEDKLFAMFDQAAVDRLAAALGT